MKYTYSNNVKLFLMLMLPIPVFGKNVCYMSNNLTRVCYKLTDRTTTNVREVRVDSSSSKTIEIYKKAVIKPGYRKYTYKKYRHNIKILLGGSKSLQKQRGNTATLKHEADLGVQYSYKWTPFLDTSFVFTKEKNTYVGIGVDF